MVPFYDDTNETKQEEDQEPQEGGEHAVVVADPQALEEDDADFDNVVQTLAVSVGTSLQDLEDPSNKTTWTVHPDLLWDMIRDCEERWKDSATVHRPVPNSPLAYLQFSPTESEQTKLLTLQQAEIADLRAQLTQYSMAPKTQAAVRDHHQRQQQLLLPDQAPDTPSSSGPAASTVSPVELIDSVPIEHIEVAVMDDHDVCSVTSGLTNLQDLTTRVVGGGGNGGIGDDAHSSSAAMDPFFGHQEPKSPADRLASSSTNIVRRAAVELHAADGSHRKAWYTGPVVANGQYTGFGYFEFPGTGDVYKGEVLNGKMHGQGTYTYATKQAPPQGRRPRRGNPKKNTTPKVLRGRFENNVFGTWYMRNRVWLEGRMVLSHTFVLLFRAVG